MRPHWLDGGISTNATVSAGQLAHVSASQALAVTGRTSAEKVYEPLPP